MIARLMRSCRATVNTLSKPKSGSHRWMAATVFIAPFYVEIDMTAYPSEPEVIWRFT